MHFQVVIRMLLTLLWAISTIAEETESTRVTTIAPVTTKNVSNSSANNSKDTTSNINKHNIVNTFYVDSSMIQRALYVLIGITIIGVLYFLVRAVRLKKTTTSRKKYGLLSNYDDSVEMAALESDEEDDTVYEARSLRR
ncbi:protein FAM174C isoform X2 [Esox lucius]|nr:protein FAM174C isoform X2 [Esox lucius]